MNLRQLEVSQAVMYGGTTKHAARLLGITQLVVSNMVRQLEDRRGFSLFDRIGGRLTRRWRPRSCQKPGARVRQCRRRGGPGRRPAPCPRGTRWRAAKPCAPRNLRDAHPISYSRISPIGVIVDDTFHERGETQHVGIGARFCFSACMLVNAGVGLAVVDEFTVCLNPFSNVETRPFKTTQRVIVSLSHAKQNPLSRLAKIFVNAQPVACRAHSRATAADGMDKDWLYKAPVLMTRPYFHLNPLLRLGSDDG